MEDVRFEIRGETISTFSDNDSPKEILRLGKGDGFWIASGAVLTLGEDPKHQFTFISDDGEMMRVENSDGQLLVSGNNANS